MRTLPVHRIGWIVASVWFLIVASVSAATRVDLAIDESPAVPQRQVAWPVTTGVPFPKGGLASTQQVRLVDDQGNEQLLQAKAAAWWDKQRSSIRWLTIDLIAQPGRSYALEFGPDVTPHPPASPLRVDADSLTVDTGALQVEFSRIGPSAFAAARIDLNNNGKIEVGETVATGPTDGDHVYREKQGHRFDSNADGEEREIVVESSGPVRSCIRVDGWYTGPERQRIVRYRARYHLFAGLQVVKLIDEFRIVGSTKEMQFAQISLPLEFKLDSKTMRVSFETLEGNVGNTDWNPDFGVVRNLQLAYRHLGNADALGMVDYLGPRAAGTFHSHERVGSWVQVTDSRGAVTGSLRWFWQQFPKAWLVTQHHLVLQLWSGRTPLDFSEAGLREFLGPAGDKYLLNWQGVKPPATPIEGFFWFAGRRALERNGADGLGINKHHEILYHFGRADQSKQGIEYGRLMDQQPLCLASGAWNCATDVFGPLAPRPNNSPYEGAVDRIFDLEREAQDDFGDYGWWLFGAGPHYSYQWNPETQRHYADPRRFEYHTYQRETQLWWCYFRSGERKFLDWASPNENHWVDIAVSHQPTTFTTDWRGGRQESAKLTWPTGDWSIDSPLHYVRHHDTGEAWLRSASQFWATYHRTLETVSLAYYLTGDERFNDVIEFWRQFWSPLAGVRSDSQNVAEVYRQQLWFKPTAPGEPSKSWAEMIRDYAPFQSGSRHQLTLFFNLATLYEHTWDPAVGQVLDEYAAAFLDPQHEIGVWRCQDNDLPGKSDSPMLAHYWAPALWKYARASGDPRMPDILHRYFMAGYHADPFAEDVGVYSNVQIGWAWYFTRDPRHLPPALHELKRLLPNALPLSKPEDLGPRIYNPHKPPQVFTAVPRLIAALDDARRQGLEPTAEPLTPQRTLMAIHKLPGQKLSMTLWGWEPQPQLLDAGGKAVGALSEHQSHKSHRMPFDRVPRDYLARQCRATIESAASKDAWFFLDPKVDVGVVETRGVDHLLCWGAKPVQLEPARQFWWQPPRDAQQLVLESAQPTQLKIVRDGVELTGKVVINRLTVLLAGSSAPLAIESRIENAPLWFRLVDVPDDACWLSARGRVDTTPPQFPTPQSSKQPAVAELSAPTFVPGRFGQGLLIVPGRELQIPDERTDAAGQARRLSDERQGTIEFWIRRQWDNRTRNIYNVELLTNGPLQVLAPARLPLDEWSHVAAVWRPSPSDPSRRLVHIYVDGRDYAWYRSIDWEGYAKPPTIFAARAWLKNFLLHAPANTSYVIDDLRISNTARYAALDVELGQRQSYNPYQFEPPAKAEKPDPQTTLLYFSFDGDLRGTALGDTPLEATLRMEKR